MKILSKQDLKNILEGHSNKDVTTNQLLDEAPYQGLHRYWEALSSGSRVEMKRHIIELLATPSVSKFTLSAFNQISYLVEITSLWECIDKYRNIAREKSLPLEYNIVALRTLTSLGWKGTLGFWTNLPNTIIKSCPAVVFSGLAQHDLKIALSWLPKLTEAPETSEQIFDILPVVMQQNKISASTMTQEVQIALDGVNQECKHMLNSWLALQKQYGEIEHIRDPSRMFQALQNFLGEDAKAKTTSSKLCPSY